MNRIVLAAGSVVVLSALGGACSSGESGSGGGTASSNAASNAASSGAKASGHSSAASTGSGGASPGPKVFLILMENHNWADIVASPDAGFITGLLATAAHAEQYFNPPGNHPSEPNYLWLEAGTNFGIQDDLPPQFNHQGSKNHLVTELEAAGFDWRSYQENIDGKTCPIVDAYPYAPKHNAMVFFDDVTNGNTASSAHCIEHVRPFGELIDPNDPTKGALAENKLKNYNFITPNLCNDMHDSCDPAGAIAAGNAWLATNVPILTSSQAYADGAVIFITWDEGEGGDGPIGMIALGKNVKPGYASQVHFDHSSTLKTVQTIYGLSPLLGAAADPTVNDLSDLFTTFP